MVSTVLRQTIRQLETRLRAWNHVYEEIRPHAALGYLTPNAFYAQWVAAQSDFGRKSVSDIY